MGNCNYRTENNDEGQNITKTHFKFHCVVGKGGFGRVWKVERKKFRSMYAMKEMSKARIIAKRSVTSVMSEKKLLCKL